MEINWLWMRVKINCHCVKDRMEYIERRFEICIHVTETINNLKEKTYWIRRYEVFDKLAITDIIKGSYG